MKLLKIKNYRNFFSVVLISLLPGAVTWLLVHFLLHSNFSNYTLSLHYNDQIGYWLEAVSFNSSGFLHGFIGINDMSKYSTISLGVHGPFYQMLYGLFGFIFNTPFLLGPILNILLFSASFIFFVYYTKISLKRSMFIMVGIITFWDVLLYIPTNMQEPIQLALAIALAGILYRFFYDYRHGIDFVKSEFALSWIFITTMSLLRPTWCFLIFVPTFFYTKQLRKHKMIILISTFVIYCMLFLVYIFKFYEYCPNTLSNIIQNMEINFLHGLKLLLKNFYHNFLNYFNVINNNVLEIFQHYLAFAFIVIMFVLMIRNIKTYKKNQSRTILTDIYRCLFHIFNLLVIIGINMVFYDVGSWRDYRVIAPFLLISILIEMAFMQYKFIKHVLTANVATVFVFLQVYASNVTYQFPVTPQQTVIHYSDYMKFSANSSMWKNTVSVSAELYDTDLVTLPRGFGVSLILSQDFAQNIKSKYLYLTPSDYKSVPDSAKSCLKPILTTKGNTLYLNNKYEEEEK